MKADPVLLAILSADGPITMAAIGREAGITERHARRLVAARVAAGRLIKHPSRGRVPNRYEVVGDVRVENVRVESRNVRVERPELAKCPGWRRGKACHESRARDVVITRNTVLTTSAQKTVVSPLKANAITPPAAALIRAGVAVHVAIALARTRNTAYIAAQYRYADDRRRGIENFPAYLVAAIKANYAGWSDAPLPEPRRVTPPSEQFSPEELDAFATAQDALTAHIAAESPRDRSPAAGGNRVT